MTNNDIEDAGQEESSDKDSRHNDPELDEEITLADRFLELLDAFDDRQNELLRLVNFVKREAESIDSASKKAYEEVRKQLGDDIDEDKIDQLIAFFQVESIPLLDREGVEISADPLNQDAFFQALYDLEEDLPEGHASSYLSGVLRALPGSGPPSSQRFLLPSLLVTLVGEFETAVGELVRICIDHNPFVMDGSDRKFTWTEVSDHGSINSFKQTVIDRMVEDVLRGTLTDWMQFFESKFGISEIKLARKYEAQEIFQRRHCIVHNGGNVSSQYVDRLKLQGKVEVGSSLEVTDRYFGQAADEIMLILWSLVWALSEKLIPDSEELDGVWSHFANGTYDRLTETRYEYLKKFGRMAPLNRLPDGHSLIIETNVWLAYKFSDDFDVVRDKVEGSEVTSRSNDFKLAKLALLDHHERAYRLAMQMIQTRELARTHFITWPLLEGVRRYWKNELGSPPLPRPIEDPIFEEEHHGKDTSDEH